MYAVFVATAGQSAPVPALLESAFSACADDR